ncbi:MAG: GntP family permease [Verrucomicrobiota bacterium]
MSHDARLLLITLAAIVGLIVLVARFKVNSFIALILASLFVGVCARMDLPKIGAAFQEGVGAVLGSIAMVIGLGAIIGKMLAESGGAEQIANTLVRLFGEQRLHWTMMLVAFIVGLPVFFAVGLVLLVPILFSIARETKTPYLHLVIPLVAGLSVAHGLVPPHPGPMAAIGLLGSAGSLDIGKVIFYSIIIGLPVAALGGPIFGKLIARVVPVEMSGQFAAQFARRTSRELPGFGITLFTILLPVLLMILATLADLTLAKDHRLRAWAGFVGHPIVSLTIATLFSFWSLGFARGFDARQILKFSEECLGAVAGALLVVGAGGGFNKVLIYSGVDKAISTLTADMHLSPILFGWIVAALIRVATGSATVAITAAAGIVAPIAAAHPGTNLELLVLSMGAGSLILSHVNDGGFWLVKEYFNLTVEQTLKTWTVMETIISLAALVLILLLDLLI